MPCFSADFIKTKNKKTRKEKKRRKKKQVNKIQLKHTKTGSNICAQILPISTCSFAKVHGTKIAQFEQTLS